MQTPDPTLDAPTESPDVLDELVGKAFTLTDSRGSIVKWTDEAAELLGWTPAEVIGRSSFQAPLNCDSSDLGRRWVQYLSRETDEVPPFEVEVLALRRDGQACRLSLVFLTVGLDLGLDVNFFLKALKLEMPRATLIDYLRREHSPVVDALTACRHGGPESTAGQTIAGVLVLMRAVSEPFLPADELCDRAAELRVEPVDERRSSVILPGPPLPVEVPNPPAALTVQQAAEDELTPVHDRLQRARRHEQEARARMAELERALEAAEAAGAESRLEAERMDAELASARSDREELHERLAGTRTERDEARVRYEQAEQEADELRALIDELKDSVRQAQLDAEQARKALERYDGEATDFEQRLGALESELDGSSARRAELEAELAGASTRRAELETELAGASTRRAELETELAGASARRAELETELASASSRRAELEQALGDAAEHVGALEAHVARTATEAEELREALTASVQRTTELESQSSEHVERARRAETERLLAVERADALQAALEQVRAAACEATRWLDGGLSVRLDSVLAELSSTRKDAAGLQTRLAAGLEGHEHMSAGTAPAAIEAHRHPDEEPTRAIDEAGSADDVPESREAAPVAETAAGAEPADSGPARDEFDATAGPRARIRPDGRFLQLNPAFCELLGYPEQELMRAMWPPATDRDNAPGLREITRRVLEGELSDAHVETCYLDPHGVPAEIVGTLTRMDGSDGEPFLELVLASD